LQLVSRLSFPVGFSRNPDRSELPLSFAGVEVALEVNVNRLKRGV